MKKTKIRFTAVLLLVIISVSQINARSISDMQKQQQDNKAKTAEVKNRLASTRSEMVEAQEELLELDAELEIVEDDIYFISNEIVKTENLLAQTEEYLHAAEESKAVQFEALKSRIRYMHENGVSGYLQILFKATSISDLLNRVDYINQIITYDKNLYAKLQETEDKITDFKTDRERIKKEQEFLKSQHLTKKASLEEALTKKSQLITLLWNEEKRYEQQIRDIEAEDKRISDMIKAAELEAARRANEANQKAVYTGGQVGWPVPSSQRISSNYGNRINPINKKPEFHKGIDIGAAHGANIIAAEGGTVIASEWMGGYGNTIIIMHGGGLTTLYAHCSSMLVSKGSTVTKGQAIAKIGSTGYSTGPHLHFEVRFNGNAQNPFPNYLRRV